MAKRTIDTDKLAQELGLAPAPQKKESAESPETDEARPLAVNDSESDGAESAAHSSDAAEQIESEPSPTSRKSKKSRGKRKAEDEGKGMFFRVDEDIWLAIGFASAAYGLTKREIINSALRQSLAHEISMIESMGKK